MTPRFRTHVDGRVAVEIEVGPPGEPQSMWLEVAGDGRSPFLSADDVTVDGWIEATLVRHDHRSLSTLALAMVRDLDARGPVSVAVDVDTLERALGSLRGQGEGVPWTP